MFHNTYTDIAIAFIYVLFIGFGFILARSNSHGWDNFKEKLDQFEILLNKISAKYNLIVSKTNCQMGNVLGGHFIDGMANRTSRTGKLFNDFIVIFVQ